MDENLKIKLDKIKQFKYLDIKKINNYINLKDNSNNGKICEYAASHLIKEELPGNFKGRDFKYFELKTNVIYKRSKKEYLITLNPNIKYTDDMLSKYPSQKKAYEIICEEKTIYKRDLKNKYNIDHKITNQLINKKLINYKIINDFYYKCDDIQISDIENDFNSNNLTYFEFEKSNFYNKMSRILFLCYERIENNNILNDIITDIRMFELKDETLSDFESQYIQLMEFYKNYKLKKVNFKSRKHICKDISLKSERNNICIRSPKFFDITTSLLDEQDKYEIVDDKKYDELFLDFAYRWSNSPLKYTNAIIELNKIGVKMKNINKIIKNFDLYNKLY